MELSEILNSLTAPAQRQEKTASHTQRGGSSLSDAIDRALEGANTEKVASHEERPSNDLIKIANDLATAEQDALIKEAHIYGMAVADGFAARMSSYTEKTASHSVDTDTLKQAMELGYTHASNAISYANNSYGEKTASFDKFAEEEQVKIAAYEKGQLDAVKVAAYIEGQEEARRVSEELTKVAHSYEDFGFNVGNSILKRL